MRHVHTLVVYSFRRLLFGPATSVFSEGSVLADARRKTVGTRRRKTRLKNQRTSVSMTTHRFLPQNDKRLRKHVLEVSPTVDTNGVCKNNLTLCSRRVGKSQIFIIFRKKTVSEKAEIFRIFLHESIAHGLPMICP